MAHVIVTQRPVAARPFVLDTLLQAFDVWRQRRRLAALDDHLRIDLGLTRDDVLRETARPLWDLPQTWRLTA